MLSTNEKKAADDFGNFSSSESARDKKKPKKEITMKQQSYNKPKRKSFNPMTVIVGVVVVLVLIAIIAGVIAIMKMPKSSSKVDDKVYFTYIDDENKYHVVVDGQEIEKTFENEIELIPADDNSFAYILEKVEEDVNGASGTRIHVLKGKKLESSGGLADECVAMSKLKPGIIYKSKKTYAIYTGDSEDPITNESTADNFIISDDAKVVVYTAASRQDEDVNILKYFRGSGSEDLQKGFTPLALSPNGRYIYGTADKSGSFYFIDAKAKEIKPKRITNDTYGTFGEITEMNANGDEIIFYTNTSKGVVSFFFSVEDKAPTTLAQGVFRSANANPKELAPSTFVGSYFVVENATISYDEDGEIELDKDGNFSTYCFKKKDGAVKVANTTGKFSPDGKYFYYIDDNSQLVRTPLSASDYAKSVEQVCGYINEFALTQKGDVYMFYESGDEKSAFLFFWDASTQKRTKLSNYADIGSMRICANTLYFSETLENGGENATVVYTSTDGSAKTPAEFKSETLDKAPTVIMGSGKKGYAYVSDEAGATDLFYTADGKKFDLVCNDCTLPNVKNNNSNNSGNSSIG